MAGMEETTFFISNLHCPSCVSSIETALYSLEPRPATISFSIVRHSITVQHHVALSVGIMCQALESAGFELHSVFQAHAPGPEAEYSPDWSDWNWSLEQAVERWTHTWRAAGADEGKKRKRHMERCEQCLAESAIEATYTEAEKPLGQIPSSKSASSPPSLESGQPPRSASDATMLSTSKPFVAVDSSDASTVVQASFAISGMTCSSCVGNVSRTIQQHPWVRSANVALLTNSASVTFHGREHLQSIIESVEDAGYDISLEEIDEVPSGDKPAATHDLYNATYTVGGMTCSSCVGNITSALKQHEWIESVDVNLISSNATVRFRGKNHLDAITETIKDAGYDATLDSVSSVDQGKSNHDFERKIAIRIDGMYCRHCPPRLMEGLAQTYSGRVKVEKPLTMSDSIIKLAYRPRVPSLTIRHILATIAQVDPAFQSSIYHPPTLEERSRQVHNRERRRVLLRLALSVVVAIPTFIIGIVYMTLLPASNTGRRYLMEPMWAGRVTRAEWALFFMATVIYFFAADIFHIRTIKGIRAMWRPGSPVPMSQRFYRFGSMNMLISLGTSMAYFASIAELAVNATRSLHPMSEAQSSYFDSVVFLTMFLLIGRFIEAYSKGRTGDAVASLGSLRPSEAILVRAKHSSVNEEETKSVAPASDQKISVDLLEVGDVVRVVRGSSPPFDGVIMQGDEMQAHAKFDESSLTGECRLVSKAIGDTVFSGTVNKGGPVLVQISSISGASWLDQIIRVVRDGQARRAPIERVADIVTGHFVPFVVLVGVCTWIIWLALGLSGALPPDYLNTDNVGGWPFWSLQFSIAVFVIACPCGVGLAAPTALFVGGGLAARYGILVKGGGEAFQEASSMDCVVFDKTGTLTKGDEPVVTAYEVLPEEDVTMIMDAARSLEESSAHPIARSIAAFCASRDAQGIHALDVEEIPGKGMKGVFRLKTSEEVTILIGNEALMADHGLQPDTSMTKTLNAWKMEAKSIALLAVGSATSRTPPRTSSLSWRLAAAFAVSDPLRPESAKTVSALKSRGLAVWLLSGDNPTTARAVGTSVGIPPENIVAGVLPEQKAEKIRYLQKSLPARRGKTRATVAMIGDGINDAPALASADVGIAVGSGSDVALSSASFILLRSDIYVLLTLIDLARTVFRRVWFNFGWAFVYNLIALPVAAGVLYPIKSNGSHVRLDPVWASLAMALSSVSVVVSSLLLRTRIPVVGFRSRSGRAVNEADAAIS